MPHDPLPILYQDDHLVAIDKPPGWLVHRSNLDRHEPRIVVQTLRDQIGRRVYPVHRLDKGTSGVLVFALDSEASRGLCRQFAGREVRKTYWAVVRGWPPLQGHIDYALGNIDDDLPEPAGPREKSPAVTDYTRLATVELPFRVDRYSTSRYALLSLHPTTGRRHQLRRHMKHISHPIIGDATYGKGRHNRLFQDQFACDRLLLACVDMTFRHPGHGGPVSIAAPVSGRFARVIHQLGW
jgi:tRNA pseudouridine65 synthase